MRAACEEWDAVSELLVLCSTRLLQLQREREELEQQKVRLKAQQEELRRSMGQVGKGGEEGRGRGLVEGRRT